MRYTKFEPLRWGNQSFMEIGYDKIKKHLCIFFLNDRIVNFEDVEEITVFNFIISTEKEDFLRKVLLPNYEHKILNNSLLVQTL